MMAWCFAVILGATTGFLSSCGLGGGTLLLIYLLEVAKMEQTLAQGINLLYFVPSALFALPKHWQSGYLKKSVILPAVGAGLVTAFFGAFLANHIELALLRKVFGGFLILVGVNTLWKKTEGT